MQMNLKNLRNSQRAYRIFLFQSFGNSLFYETERMKAVVTSFAL